jgi:hypothetical protein|tara:strand:- start:3670 stop:4296 length:627 start_codon:yes stop_codon:yes gene_type:complete
MVRIFVLGTAPRLLDLDLSLLNNEITIGMNNILRSEFVPNYLCVSDGELVVRDFDYVFSDKMKDSHYYLCDHNIPTHIQLAFKNRYNVTFIPRFDREDGKYYIDPKLKTITLTGSTSVHDLGIPLAVHLGAKEIYLLGCDSGYAHFYDTDQSYKPRFHSGFEENWPGRQGRFKHVTEILDEWNIKLYNCDPSDRLKDMEYIDFYEVIS